jgi:hypothetical protein
MIWADKDAKARIVAGTVANGTASLMCVDRDGKPRINASTLADGTANLSTTDLKPNP